MLPSVVTREITDALRAQLIAQFPTTSSGFLNADGGGTLRSVIEELVSGSNTIFKGPYISFGLPFLTAEAGTTLPFEAVHIPYAPYRHQLKAFQRLSGPNPQPTLVATGTGSGKTECFMFPILEHCAQNPGPGVKSIIIYPMNALAQDQARRFAEEIHGRESLRGKIRVGIFTGESETTRHKVMSANSVITCKKTQRKNPPDILLTNYKMLDYMLIRPRDRELWRFNEPETLRFLVVDELHTFDGAQGTDLACLIRRLNDRLETGDNLACVGTSATVGGNTAALVAYASEVFDKQFHADAVLREERQSAEEFLPATGEERWPAIDALTAFASQHFDSPVGYAKVAHALWFEEPIAGLDSTDDDTRLQACHKLGQQLGQLAAFRTLLSGHTEVADVQPLVKEWSARLRISEQLAAVAVESLVALASIARNTKQPFVTVRSQLWLRELRRIVATVDGAPRLEFSDDLSPEAQKTVLRLPVLHCNQCHAMGWVSLRQPASEELVRDLRSIYDAFFNGNPDTCVLFPKSDDAPDRAFLESRICSDCGVLNRLNATACSRCEAGEDRLQSVIRPDMSRQHQEDGAQVRRFHRDCPYCESHESLLILGSRAATLSSVAINQIFNSTLNTDPKLIAFSDSVQDAAHRAGFFESRTFRQVMRGALATSVHHSDFTNLGALIDGFGPDWQARFLSDSKRDEDFVGTFIPPDLEWLRDWEQLQTEGALPRSSTLIDQWLLPRMRWEVLSEFGLRSRLGRTLERSRIAIAYVDPALLERTVPGIVEALREQVAELADVSVRDVTQFVLGLLWRLRTRGGFYDVELQSYLLRGGDVFQLRRRQFLPKFGRQSATPTFLTLNRERRAFDHIVDTGTTWYQNWFNKTLAVQQALASASVGQAFLTAITRLARSDELLFAHAWQNPGRDETTVWALNPTSWLLSKKVSTLVCDRCRNRLQIAAQESEHWQGMACLQSQCAGAMQAETQSSVNRPISDRPPTRLITAEHTAVLDSAVRDHVERSFKASPGEIWDINLLSATPTMEMGVDIGDLSSVLLCSVPPAQSNYLQRIGRAGRRDGNALNMTIANGVPHDLYFFANPVEMMQGEVQPPGVFLGAIAVLERQMVAYCFDQWVKTGIDEDAIPAKLGTVLSSIERADAEKFPQTFLSFIDSERGRITRDFLNLFPNLPSQGIDQLQQYLYGEYGGRPGITFRISHLLHEKVQQRARLRSDIDHLKREMDRLMRQPKDEATDAAISETQAERGGLMRLVRKMNEQYTLNFFTDEGLLPNYAFPEEGVKLSSIIYRRRQQEQGDESESPFERIEFEIRRPAHVALRELAPFSRFYGNSRQVEIDQIELRSTPPEQWRLCNRCSYAENLATGDTHETCPRCGSFGWINAAQKQDMVRLREVYANASDRESRIGDDNDDREPVFFNRQFLFDADEEHACNAYRIDDPVWPFGFEYLPTATLREINFGRELAAGPDIEVAGNTAKRAGFQVCMQCGKLRKYRPRPEDNHTRRCPMRSEAKDIQLENTYSALYLYRELHSEAVRVLLPFAEVAQSPVRLQSFIAALHLGLKEHFLGNVDHLQISHYSEPVGATELRRQYLVFMDSIPGGTGYLRELLSNPSHFEAMLKNAYDVLQACGCQHEANKDGCYRCLYAFRESYRLPETSRQSALETLGNILERWESLEKIPAEQSLKHTDINALFDSELERLFIEVLGNTRGCSIAAQHTNGKPGYVLAVKGEEGKKATRWSIEPQVDIGPTDGVAVPSRPDFLLLCLSESDTVLPVAIFLDGFEYHADSADQDTRKRFALMQAKRCRVWSLAWNDLPVTGSSPQSQHEAWLEQPQPQSAVPLFDQIATQSGMRLFAQQNRLTQTPAFALLVQMLANPLHWSEKLAWYALSRVFGLVDQAASQTPNETLQRVGTWLPPHWQDRHMEKPLLLGSRDLPGQERTACAVASIPQQAIRDGDFEKKAALCLRLDDRDTESDGYKQAWHRFWSTSNIMQFLPHFLPVTITGLEKANYAEILEFQSVAEESGDGLLSAAWEEAIELSPYQDELRSLEKTGLNAPEIGVDIQDQSGEVIATLEWAWLDKKAGFFDAEGTDVASLQSLGWTVVKDLQTESIAQLIEALK